MRFVLDMKIRRQLASRDFYSSGVLFNIGHPRRFRLQPGGRGDARAHQEGALCRLLDLPELLDRCFLNLEHFSYYCRS